MTRLFYVFSLLLVLTIASIIIYYIFTFLCLFVLS